MIEQAEKGQHTYKTPGVSSASLIVSAFERSLLAGGMKVRYSEVSMLLWASLRW